jgi:hypothetical protein
MHHPRELVVMTANGHIEGFSHHNVVRYDGTNLEEVKYRMQERFIRRSINVAVRV